MTRHALARFLVLAAAAAGCSVDAVGGASGVAASGAGAAGKEELSGKADTTGNDAVPGEAGVAAAQAAPGASVPGGVCSCSSDCPNADGSVGICVEGICMYQPTAACPSQGSTRVCPRDSRCFTLRSFRGNRYSVCWPDYSSACAGYRDADGSCAPTRETPCVASCSSVCEGNATAEEPPAAPSEPAAAGGGSAGTEPAPTGTSTTSAAVATGGACDCNSECIGDATHAGICVEGICMHRPTAACPAQGDASVCPGGSRCFSLRSELGNRYSICWPDFSTDCAGYEDTGSCGPSRSNTCDASCSAICEANAIDGTSPAPTPDEPTTDDELDCGDNEIILLPGSVDPASERAARDGYYIDNPRVYSYVECHVARKFRAVVRMVREAFPGTGPLGVGDLTQRNGRTPGSDAGSLRHPSGTHHGPDMDLAYYQKGRTYHPVDVVCGDGTDVHGVSYRFNNGSRCTVSYNNVDWRRQAYFMAKMAVQSGYRITGIDTTMGSQLRTALDELLEEGLITGVERDAARRPATTWPYHHHHQHVSFY